jgi:hypothetical protein
MADGAYLVELAASLFYLLVGARLLWLGQRTGEAPERFLGVYFVLHGVAYVGWVLPYVVELESWRHPADFAAWALFSIGVVPYLLFIRRVFRPAAGWATWLVIGFSVALAASTAVLAWGGELYPGFGNPFYWVQWFGYTIPSAWFLLEASLAHRVASRRSKIGLSDPAVVNRYLLLALFGALQTLACFSDLLVTIDVTADQSTSVWSDALLGGTEIAGVSLLWLAFFPPAWYVARVAGTSTSGDAAAGVDHGGVGHG